LKFYRNNARNVSFSADHVCFTPVSGRELIAPTTVSYDPKATFNDLTKQRNPWFRNLTAISDFSHQPFWLLLTFTQCLGSFPGLRRIHSGTLKPV
jgi:hypothetical protein